ncbi:two-component system sensor histidine kinase NtrB [Paraglaciecola chathamensis]|uniref:Sensor protein FixL n=1 Tax=Paraglaciecola chathamensis S18K6 TaxID=1127672 RepID=A0AAV3UXB9_9ALTE|nr:PAS domain S-box protein [Paraglaciecola chathamensis]GAC09838.1 sensor protein fixL [Paraglaciecola chathamensis S18K6]
MTDPINQPSSAQSAIDANAQLNALLDAAVDAMIIIDHKGGIELFNAAAQRMFGYSVEEVLGKNVKILMPAPYQEEHDKYLDNYMKTNHAKIIGIGREVRACKKNGKVFPIELSVGEVKDSSHKQFVGIIRDISEQVKARSDAIASREKLAHVTRLSTMGEMAAGIAHEINQPLSAVSSYAQACKNMLVRSSGEGLHSLQQQKLTSALEKISHQALRAGEVIRRLRAFVKKRNSERDYVDFNALIEETIDLAKVDTRLLDHGIEVTLNSSPAPFLMIDQIQIQQVLFNLIRNAIDAMEEQPTDPVVIDTRWLNEQYLEISVIDTGYGISAQNAERLFHPFFTTKPSGMGMGLPICQSIIQSHGGELKHTPGKPKGSIFSFTLPAKPQITSYSEDE